MSAITVGTSLDRAKKRFPYTAPQHIRGTGEYVLAFRCYHRWRVLLFPTAEARDAAYQRYEGQSCGAPSCVHNHVKLAL
jgi:hypothetical protein